MALLLQYHWVGEGEDVAVLLKRFLLWLVCVLTPMLAMTQTTPTYETVPVFSAGMGFVPTVTGGQTSLNSTADTVLLVPFGEKWLVESRATFEGDFERQNGAFVGAVGKSVDYLEVDYVANKYVTVTAGRFLTPFGIYNERLYPVWIRNLQTEPFLVPMEEGSNNGAMVRGGFALSKNVVFNYATYFSTLATNQFLSADRQIGTRLGLFFPKQRLEVGFSFLHKLVEEHANNYGVHLVWQPTSVPLDVRSEFAHTNSGYGYWIEPALKLSSIRKFHTVMSRTQLVGRVQQFVPNGIPDDDELPTVKSQQAEFGINYYIMDGLRVTGSTGRQFSSDGNHNIWTVGMTYRFAVPLGRGGSR